MKKSEEERLGGAWAQRKEVEDEKTLIETFDVEKEGILEEGKVKSGSHFDQKLGPRSEDENMCEGMVSLRLRMGKVLQQYEATVGG